MPENISLRPIGPEDEPFLLQLIAGLQAEQWAASGLSADQLSMLLKTQHTAQQRSYESACHEGSFDLILQNGEPIGRLYVDRRPDEIRIADISLLPEHRGAGIGTRLIGQLATETERTGKPLRLHVQRDNHQAIRLYKRLGFSRVSESGVHCLMERSS